ncbi:MULTISPECIES: oligopeptide/dipeptide ABC transporter ATP-binding protein [Methanosphaera]|uniref:Nickel import system ATP-binding protein NikD n=2 Tax=Methanosphaera stadtmanae TaxID=2317 RepID=Q2NG51_METST|nr:MULTISPECIES: ABC transporter ATP-binding protein [Methanosphaera]ABC57202.1 predicted ABC-type dipeptide transport system, ATP-binding protein [Methanosphaera stadtmanae DSM 3091]OEC87932.1 peptide ABC transporter ATP-binding protein [Methanosphaera sp. A6]RAP03136.1 peptide ABC transporter ATP-binding protein [Methanosphaera stadtmanae]RAP47399.1 MAG: peptide ABC transporter ATP-binding protein [Methanosphaera sp. DEW79]
MKLLEIKNLSISFTQYIKGLEQRELKVISDLTMDIHDHEILAVLGASGSGKSLLAHAILGILPENANVSGTIKYKHQELTPTLQEKLRGKNISLIPQSVNYLNPLMKVKEQAIGYIEDENQKKLMLEKQRKIFEKYGLSEKVDEMYPFQLSGGMARKVLISTALLNSPDTIIADEPTPGLDEEAVNETIRDLIELKNNGVGMLLITHDILTAIKASDKIAIIYLGYVIEITKTENFLTGKNLLHPYTRALYDALPENEFKLTLGHQPSYTEIPKGCPYNENCPYKTEECINTPPKLEQVNDTQVRCYHPLN